MGRCTSLLVMMAWFLATVHGHKSYISGARETCTNEGEPVIVEYIKNMHCYKCICKNGFVECQQSCPPIDGCQYILRESQTDCCKQCKGCVFRGRHRDSHTEWTEPSDPCTVFRCEAGIITESVLQCYTPCRSPLPPRPGRCCYTCPGCRINGQNVTADRDVTIPEDPCVKCHCDGGRMTCVKKACPVLHCKGPKRVQVPGECCPRCVGQRTLFGPKGSGVLGDDLVENGEHINPDRCTKCRCENETILCKRNTCPVLECHPEKRKLKPGDCCPHCPPTEETYMSCTFGGKVYKDGESWQLDPCKSCMCQNGVPRCAMQRCPPREQPCPPNYKLVRSPGQCCAKCVENDGVCTVFGDPHYKTFDGKFFSFQGSCKYQLVADCQNHTFSVRVTNDARSTKHSAWTKTVSVKVGDLKINLGQKMRVKVNGKRVEPPYTLPNLVQVDRRNGSVLVSTHVGISVLWDGYGFLEVYASPSHKGKVCGLCGNYNSVAQDDLRARRGRLMSEAKVAQFATSWRVGGKKACARHNEHLYPARRNVCRNKADKAGKTQCRYLKMSEQFGMCDTKLNPSNYFEACLQDMCECPNIGCYCDSLTAYAHECARLGVILPDWMRDTGCRPGGASRRLPPPQQSSESERQRGRGSSSTQQYPQFSVRDRFPSFARPGRGPPPPILPFH